jgi:Ca2+/H+ antiporter
MKARKVFVYNFRTMIVIALISGFMSIIIQLFDGFEGLGFLLAVTGMSGLFGGIQEKADKDPRLPAKSFKTAFECLLLVMMVAMVFLMISNGYRVFPKANDFLSTHWPGLTLSVMCIVLAISGLRQSNQTQSV